MSRIAIIMGSDSDLKVMSETAKLLDSFNIDYEITIVSAHRTVDRLYDFATNARSNGFKVIIAGAGGAAHLPGMVSAITSIPVIGVPIKSSTMSGLDSLYSIVQMPSGIPVATVAINGAQNAAILALEILGTYDDTIYEKLSKYKEDLKLSVENKAEKLNKLGYSEYINKLL